MLLIQLHLSRWRNQCDVTDTTITTMCKANARQPTQGVEGVQEHTKQETAQGVPTSVQHVEERIGSLINGVGYGKRRRNSWTKGCRGRGRSGSRRGGGSGGGSRGGSRDESGGGSRGGSGGGSGSRGRRRGGGRLGFLRFSFFSLFSQNSKRK